MNDLTVQSLMNRLLVQHRESELVELKENNQDPEMIGKLISGLANSAALLENPFAYLIFGVRDGSMDIVGTTFTPHTTKKGNEDLELWLSKMLLPRINFQIHAVQYKEKSLVIFQIPAAPNRPVLFQNIGYIRIGSITKSLLEYPEKEKKLWQRPSQIFELENALLNVSAAQVVALLDTQFIFDSFYKTPYPTTQDHVIEKLIADKFIIRSNGHFHITNLGALLFAKNLASFPTLERKAPRVVQYKGISRADETLKDTMGVLGYANGFDRMIGYISALLPTKETIEIGTRQEIAVFPIIAVRELVANALIHQDFREQGTNVTIEIFEDRIEIKNPGKPIVDTLRFIDGNQSRNEKLATTMRKIGICEERGSGIDKVFSLCEKKKLPAPDFRTIEVHTQALLFAPKNWQKMSKEDKIRICYQHCCLQYVNNQNMTNQTMRDRLDLEQTSNSVVTRIIKDTMISGLIKPSETGNVSKKFSAYIPAWA